MYMAFLFSVESDPHINLIISTFAWQWAVCSKRKKKGQKNKGKNKKKLKNQQQANNKSVWKAEKG